MAYVDDLLASNERILLRAHRHVLFVVLNTLPYVLGVILLWALAVVSWTLVPRIGSILGALLAVASLGVLGMAIWRFLAWRSETYVVTTLRVIQVEGIVNKRVFDSSLEKINDVMMTQSVFGRLFDYGTIKVLTGSDLGLNDLIGLAEPFAFKKALVEAKVAISNADEDFRRSSPRSASSLQTQPSSFVDTGEPDDTSRAVVALTELRNAGLISEAEFTEKMRQALGR
jgi:uncharacterized membrane protein YdbT with pleckstrin-like domain